MDKEENSTSESNLYNRMVGHLGDYFAKIKDEEAEDEKSLYESLENVSKRYINAVPLAEGGMKEIFKVDDHMTGRPVAKAVIKNLKSKETVEQFIQEARITARLEHPNIMPVYDIGLDELGHAFFTMKLIDGDNLGDIIKNLRKKQKKYEELYPLSRLLEIFIKVCDAVAYAHDKGILHLDLKPDNIQVGDFGEVLVCDWGLSRYKPGIKSDASETIEYLEGQLTLHGQVFGSPGFMSPEQVTSEREELTHQSDIYSLGCLLYSILTLKPAFSGKTVDELLDTTARGEFKAPSKMSKTRYVPSALEAVCLHAMEYEPKGRYAKSAELKSDVTAFMNGYATYAEKASPLTKLVLFVRRHAALVSLAAALLMVTGLFAVIYLNQEKVTKKVVEELGRKEAEKEQVSQEKAKLEVDALLRAKQNFLRFTNPRFLFALNSLKSRDFKAAANKFGETEDETLKPYALACNELVGDYNDRRLPAKKLLRLLALLNNDLYTAVIEELLRKEAKHLNFDEKKRLCKQVLDLMNPGCNIKYNVNQFLGKVYITLKDSTGLRYISALSLFSASVVDISNTEIMEIGSLVSMPLTNLNISNTRVEDLAPIKDSPLAILNLSHSKVVSLKLLEKAPLQSIDITGLDVNWKELSKIQTLRKVLVSETAKIDESTLPPYMKILRVKN